MMLCRLLSDAEHSDAEARRLALGKARGLDGSWMQANNAKYGWASLSDVIAPGSMWFSTWYFDPKDPGDKPRRDHALARIANGTFKAKTEYLSRFYWLTWSTKRSPISVLCPNGAEWCIDAVSSNGEGWTVEGDAPLLKVAPSIDVPGYHGFLGNNGAAPGHFTKDLANRGPGGMGLPR